MFSPHFWELFYLHSSLVVFGCPLSSLQHDLFKWRKVAEGLGEQVLGGTLCCCQLIFLKSIEYFSFNFPIVVSILLCQMVFGALPGPHVPESGIHLGQTLPHIEEGTDSRKAQRAMAPRNLSLMVWARPRHFGPSGKFWTRAPASVSYIFFFSFPKFPPPPLNSCSLEIYIYYCFICKLQGESSAWGLQLFFVLSKQFCNE